MTILGGFISVLGLVLLIVPGVYLYVCFAVAMPVLLTEGLKGRHALGRSRRLVKGRFWRTFGVVVPRRRSSSASSRERSSGSRPSSATLDTADPTLASFLANTTRDRRREPDRDAALRRVHHRSLLRPARPQGGVRPAAARAADRRRARRRRVTGGPLPERGAAARRRARPGRPAALLAAAARLEAAQHGTRG